MHDAVRVVVDVLDAVTLAEFVVVTAGVELEVIDAVTFDDAD